jgi:hypothetical protein
VIEVLHRCSVEEGMTSFVPSHQKRFSEGADIGAPAPQKDRAARHRDQQR